MRPRHEKPGLEKVHNIKYVSILCNRLSRSSLRMAARNGIVTVNIINCPALNRSRPGLLAA